MFCKIMFCKTMKQPTHGIHCTLHKSFFPAYRPEVLHENVTCIFTGPAQKLALLAHVGMNAAWRMWCANLPCSSLVVMLL